MSELQKIIKYFAMAFAAFLAFTIVSGIVTAILAITGFFSYSTTTTTQVDGTYNYSNVQNIDIDHGVGTLIIKIGDSDDIIVETTNVTKNFTIKQKDNGDLHIQDEQQFMNVNVFGNGLSKNKKIVIYLPKDFVAEQFDIDAGAGNIEIDGLKTEKLMLTAGFGNVEGDNIIADSCDLESGVGNINLTNVDIGNFNIEGGVGNIKIEGNVYGKTIVECGIGNIKLTVRGDINDYNLNVDKGIGTIKVNGNSYSQIDGNRNASNLMSIEGGIGNIDIIFEEAFGF